VDAKAARSYTRPTDYQTLAELRADLDAWLVAWNARRPHQGRWCYGKTPLQTFLDSVPLAKENRWKLSQIKLKLNKVGKRLLGDFIKQGRSLPVACGCPSSGRTSRGRPCSASSCRW
jgi:hypothetical protein